MNARSGDLVQRHSDSPARWFGLPARAGLILIVAFLASAPPTYGDEAVDVAVATIDRSLEKAMLDLGPRLTLMLEQRTARAQTAAGALLAQAAPGDRPAALAAVALLGSGTTAPAASAAELCRADPDVAMRLHGLAYSPLGWPEAVAMQGGPLLPYHRLREGLLVALRDAASRAPADDPTAMATLACYAPMDPVVVSWRRTDADAATLFGRWIDPLERFEMEHGVAGVELQDWVPAEGALPQRSARYVHWGEAARWDLPEPAPQVRLEAVLEPGSSGTLSVLDAAGVAVLAVSMTPGPDGPSLRVVAGAQTATLALPAARLVVIALEVLPAGASVRCWNALVAHTERTSTATALRYDGSGLDARCLRLRYLGAPVGGRPIHPVHGF